MPQIIPYIVTAATKFLMVAGFSQATAAAIVTWGGRFLVTAGLSALSKTFAPKPQPVSVSNPGWALNLTPEANAPRQFIYGETGLAGQPVFDAVTGADNKYYHMIIALGDGGPYSAIQEVQLSGEVITMDGGSSGTLTAPSKWAGKAFFEFGLGDTGISASPLTQAVGDITEWQTSTHIGKGVCQAHVRFEYDPEVWTTGRPRPMFKVRGRTGIYDPRLDSSPGNNPTNAGFQAWTQNPALWALDYIRGVYMNSQLVLGLGIPDELIDYDSFSDAAAVCDESVNVKGGGAAIKRYTGGGCVVTADDDPLSVLGMFSSAMAGVITTRSGKIACYAGEQQTAAVTLTDDDLAGKFKVTSGASIRTTANACKAKFFDPALGYEWTDAPAYRNSTWETEDDGVELWTDLSLGSVQDHRVVQRLAKIYAADKREPREISGKYKIKALQISENEVFTLDSDSFGAAVNGKYKLIKRTINPDGTVSIVARSETDAKWSWNENTEERDATAATTLNPTFPTTQTPTGWTAVSSTYTGVQGASYTSIDVNPGGTIPATIGQVEIQAKRQASATLTLDFRGDQYASSGTAVAGDASYVPIATLSRQQAANGYRINGAEQARIYSVRVRYISYAGIPGSWQEIEVSVGVASNDVPTPTGWTAASGTLTSAEGYTRPVIAVSAPSVGIPAGVSVVNIDYRKPADAVYSGQVSLSKADASLGYDLPAEPGATYFVRVRYGSDPATLGPEQVIVVDADATAAIALAGLTLADGDTTDGTYTFPGIKVSWTALSGDELARANSITIQYRRNGDTEVSTVVAEPDATSVNIWGLLPGVNYDVRARVEEVYQSGSWTDPWLSRTVGSTFTSSGFNGQGDLATFNTLDWGDAEFTGVPANLGALTGSEVITNTSIAISGGAITGIGTGTGTQVANSAISISAAGVLSGAGGGTVSLTSLGGTVGTSQIANAAVTTTELGDDAVTRTKILAASQTDTLSTMTSVGTTWTSMASVAFDNVQIAHLVQFEGTIIGLQSVADGGASDAAGTANWEIRAHDDGDEATRLDGTLLASGTFTTVDNGGGIFWDSSYPLGLTLWEDHDAAGVVGGAEFYKYRRGLASDYPIDIHFVLWVKVGSGSMTAVYIEDTTQLKATFLSPTHADNP